MRRARLSALVSGAVLVVASCGRFDGEDDPALPPSPAADGSVASTEGGPPPGPVVDPPDAAATPADAGLDADGGPATLPLDAWSTPNGAVFVEQADGIRITGHGGPINHPAVVATVQAKAPVEAYTVHARIRADDPGEFGVVTRHSTGRAVLFGAKWGQERRTFLARVDGAWDPLLPSVVFGAPYVFETGRRWNLRVRMDGTFVSAKLWRDGDSEPLQAVEALLPADFPRGQGVGFYVYMPSPGTEVKAVLEQLFVTSP